VCQKTGSLICRYDGNWHYGQNLNLHAAELEEKYKRLMFCRFCRERRQVIAQYCFQKAHLLMNMLDILKVSTKIGLKGYIRTDTSILNVLMPFFYDKSNKAKMVEGK